MKTQKTSLLKRGLMNFALLIQGSNAVPWLIAIVTFFLASISEILIKESETTLAFWCWLIIPLIVFMAFSVVLGWLGNMDTGDSSYTRIDDDGVHYLIGHVAAIAFFGMHSLHVLNGFLHIKWLAILLAIVAMVAYLFASAIFIQLGTYIAEQKNFFYEEDSEEESSETVPV